MKNRTTKAKSQSSNELFAIHVRGQLLPHKVYQKLGTARGAMRYLTPDSQQNGAIVRYVPGEVVEHSKDTIEAYKARQAAKKAKHAKQIREYNKRRLEHLKKEAEELEKKLEFNEQD